MASIRAFSEIRLVNGSAGDPVLYIDYPGKDNALLFDAGENGGLDTPRLADLEAVFITHHHVNHFIGLDRIVRANIDRDKTLHVFGPVNTIRKVYDRIESYEYQFFPFQKIAIRVSELLPGRMRSAVLECTRRFPEPTITETDWAGPVVHENADLTVEAAPADHTVPCWSYALVEKTGFHPDPLKLAAGGLRPGPWIGRVLELLRAGADPATVLEIHGGRFALGWVGEQYFAVSRGARVAFVTDTAWSESVRPGLIRLARRATRLYCDAFYSHSHAKQADTHRHMTTVQAAEFAALAKVDELVLMHFAARYHGKFAALLDEARAAFPDTSADLS